MGILLYCCSEEDTIIAERKPYRRSYDSTTTDPVKKFEADYYYAYNKVFITDVDSVDYLFNFTYKNTITIQQPRQNNDHLLYGIDKMKKLFLDYYSPEFIKKYFPFSLIIADGIFYDSFGTPEPTEIWVANNFIALNIGEITENLSKEEERILSAKLHQALLFDICWKYMKSYNADPFFKHTRQTYGQQQNSKFTPMNLYEAGYLKDHTKVYFTVFPSQAEDLQDWIEFILVTPEQELRELLNSYSLLNDKFESLTTILKEQLQLDYMSLKKDIQ